MEKENQKVPTRKQKRDRVNNLKRKMKSKAIRDENHLLKEQIDQASPNRSCIEAVCSMKVIIPSFDGNVQRVAEPFASGRYGSVQLSKISSMGLLVAEKTVKDRCSHKLEASLGFLMSGHPNFPVMFGQTNDSVLMEFIGDPATKSPGDTLLNYSRSTCQINCNWLDIGQQVVTAFSALHMKGVLHNDIHPKNVLIHPLTKLVKVVDFGMACMAAKPRVYRIGGTKYEALWNEKYPHIAYEIRHFPCQPATEGTDTFSIGHMLKSLGHRVGCDKLVEIGSELCNDNFDYRCKLVDSLVKFMI